ncbi:MAG: hypothetical protein E6230_15910 [Paenibacillus dendritiformis]|uniref:hypothetical protein n=1 Tax=uncultured Paenibacillus sp. TaxID=227322 RepID=UPI0025DEF9B6|nr:hypothetical protein [uncultured Paenibacillus sp.]MDU5143663.1 hypothetical protein [Paenibacillus dendritiformis]
MSHKNTLLNNQLVALTKEYFEKENVSLDFIRSVFDELVTETNNVIPKVKINFEFSGLEGKDGVSFSNERYGKIFEVTGTNQRFKTTSLIIMGLILNYNFLEAEQMLSSTQLVSRVNEVTKQLFTSNDFVVKFFIDSGEYSFRFIKSHDKISAITKIKGIDIELSSNLSGYNDAFTRYCEFIQELNLADVQFVSKGRNFVGHVHKEITDEFIMTLESIKNSVDKTVKKFMEKVNYNDNLKEETEIRNEITYISKAIDLISKIDLPFSIIDDVHELSKVLPGEMGNNSINKLNEYEQKIEKELNKLCIEIEKNKSGREDSVNRLEQYIVALNSYEGLPYKFGLDNLANKLELFLEEWDDVLVKENGVIFWGVTENCKGRKIVPQVIGGKFFGHQINIKTIDDYQNYINKINSMQSDIASLKEYIVAHEKIIKEELSHCNEIKRKQVHIIAQVDELKKKLSKIRNLIKLCAKLDCTESNETVSDFLSKVIRDKNFSNYINLFKCIDKTDFSYGGEDKESLTRKLEFYKKELEESLKNDSNKFLLPKKLRDINSMTKIIQDIRAVTEYLQLDNMDDVNSIQIVEASLRTNLHRSIIELFNKYMFERCKYYFEVKDVNNVRMHNLLDYDFEKKEFFIKDRKVSTSDGISGGTDSAMTVRSFASKKNNAYLGLILLVDEWGDVGTELASKVYESIMEIETFGCGIFVKVDHQLDKAHLQSMR